MKKLVVITGPTAVGKSDISIQLAKKLNGEIISADSMQVYRGMDIGTAKLSLEDMQGIKHHLIDIIDPDTDYDAYTFKASAQKIIEKIHDKDKLPIVVGGTGFYINALCYDSEFEKTDEKLREELKEKADEYGIDSLFCKLKEKDPEYADIAKGNEKRIIRALEFYYTNGYPLSLHNKKQREKSSPYDLKFFVLTKDRQKLYDDINRRVDIMVENGLLEEAKTIFSDNKNRNSTAAKAIGYRELIEYFDGQMSLTDAIEKIKQNTRHFAKRQLTWFKGQRDVIWVNKDDFSSDDEVLEFLMGKINE